MGQGWRTPAGNDTSNMLVFCSCYSPAIPAKEDATGIEWRGFSEDSPCIFSCFVLPPTKWRAQHQSHRPGVGQGGPRTRRVGFFLLLFYEKRSDKQTTPHT